MSAEDKPDDDHRLRTPWATISFIVGCTYALPFALGRPIPHSADYTYHGALIESQYRSLQAFGRWSPYLDALGGIERFSLRPAIYGGTAYGLIAPLRFFLPLGAVLAVSIAVAFGAISWGLFTAARSAGSPPLAAFGIAAASVSSGAVVAILYGRTAIAELIAWGALAAGIGAYAALRVAPDPQRRHRVVLFTASAIFFGGHPLTLVFASALIATVLVAAAIGGARPTRRDRGPAALVLAGAAITLWQWPLSIFHLTLTSAPDTQVSLSTGAFLAPTGTGSEPRLVEVLDPRRIGLDGNGTWGISNEISLLLLALLVALLLHRLWNSSRLRPLVTPGALLGITLAIVVVPHSLRLTRLIPMVGAMQYYWRFFPYAVGALAAALVLVVRLIPDHQRRFVVFALAAAGILELTFGQVQAWRPIHPEMGTTISAAATVADLNPNPIYRNGGRAERDLDLPILEKVDAVPTPAVTPADAEAPLVVEVPGPSRVAVPSAVAPPFVRLAPTDRAVGWYVASRAAATGFESDQLWLVVDHRSAEQQLSVQTSGTPTVTFARVGGAVALPTFAAVVVLLLLPRRRPRRSASGYDPQHEGSDGASDNPHRRDVRGVPGQ